jgi:hypothetical protein
MSIQIIYAERVRSSRCASGAGVIVNRSPNYRIAVNIEVFNSECI